MRKLSDEQLAQIKPLYESGVSYGKIAVMFNVNPEAIRWRMKDMGIERRGFDTRQEHRAFPINRHFFEIIDSEVKAYWLGFFAADGYIAENDTMVGMQIQERDRAHLMAFRAAIESEHVVLEGRTSTNPFVRLQFRCREMIADLERFWITPRKSFTVRWPCLEHHLLRHYLRGYFDGDGTASAVHYPGRRGFHMRFMVIGTEVFLQECQAYLMQECDLKETKFYHPKKCPDMPYMSYVGAPQCMRIAHLMYDDATVYLPRKHDIFAPYMNIYPPAGVPYKKPRRMSDRLQPTLPGWEM